MATTRPSTGFVRADLFVPICTSLPKTNATSTIRTAITEGTASTRSRKESPPARRVRRHPELTPKR